MLQKAWYETSYSKNTTKVEVLRAIEATCVIYLLQSAQGGGRPRGGAPSKRWSLFRSRQRHARGFHQHLTENAKVAIIQISTVSATVICYRQLVISQFSMSSVAVSCYGRLVLLYSKFMGLSSTMVGGWAREK